MGWKVSLLILSERDRTQVVETIKTLGLGESLLSNKTSLVEVLYSEHLYIGFFNDCAIIAGSSILNNFFDSFPSRWEKKFCELFHDSEIMVIGQIENAGINGFSIIKNGQRIRTRLERDEEGVILDIGQPLKAENDINVHDLPFAIPQALLGCNLDSDKVLQTTMYKIS